MLRITGGYLAGKRILSIPGKSTRPPLTRIRESVANILQSYTEGAAVLDLFAGTGSFSFELLSRGAKSAVLIDKNPRAIQILQENASRLNVQNVVRVIKGDALRVVKKLENSEEKFDIIIVAPPYFTNTDQKSMEKLASAVLLDPYGIVVLQQATKEVFREKYGLLQLRKTYRYGHTRISTYIKCEIL